MLRLFLFHVLEILVIRVVNKQRHLAGNFRGFLRSSLLDMFILAVFLLSIYWCLVPMLHSVGQFHYFALVDFLLSEYFLVLLFFVLICVR